MDEITKSFRIETELCEAVERLAKARGQNFSAFVVTLLTATVENKQAAAALQERAPAGGADLDFLRGEMRVLGDALRTERLMQSEIVDSLMALSKLTRELEREREATVRIVSDSVKGLEESKKQLKEMVELGGFADKKCRETVTALEKMQSSTVSSAAKIQSFLGAVEGAAQKSEALMSHQLESLGAEITKGTSQMKELTSKHHEMLKYESNRFATEIFKDSRLSILAGGWVVVALVAVLLIFFTWNFVSSKSGGLGWIQPQTSHGLPA